MRDGWHDFDVASLSLKNPAPTRVSGVSVAVGGESKKVFDSAHLDDTLWEPEFYFIDKRQPLYTPYTIFFSIVLFSSCWKFSPPLPAKIKFLTSTGRIFRGSQGKRYIIIRKLKCETISVFLNSLWWWWCPCYLFYLLRNRVALRWSRDHRNRKLHSSSVQVCNSISRTEIRLLLWIICWDGKSIASPATHRNPLKTAIELENIRFSSK